MNHILLVGFMGAGKSTVAALVAEMLGRPCVDLDAMVETQAGRKISQIFAEDGETGFRSRETAALAGLADAAPSVVACGGGVVTVAENRRLLKTLGQVIYLRVTAQEMLARVGEDPGRPLLSGGGGLLAATTLLDARESLYTAVADLSVNTVGRRADQVAEEIIRHVESRTEG